MTTTTASAHSSSLDLCQPLSPLRLFWLGTLGAALGAFVETVFMLLTTGQLQSRSSLLFGQFSLVWGGAAVLLTLLLRPLAPRGKAAVFLAGAGAGCGFEFLCSWFLELAFGAIFWDYSHLPLSLGGRINLIFACFWGAAALVWIFYLLPGLNLLLDRVPRRLAGHATAAMALFLTLSISLTVLALARSNARHAGTPPQSQVDLFLDTHWDDHRLAARFANMQNSEEYIVEHPNFW